MFVVLCVHHYWAYVCMYLVCRATMFMVVDMCCVYRATMFMVVGVLYFQGYYVYGCECVLLYRATTFIGVFCVYSA